MELRFVPWERINFINRELFSGKVKIEINVFCIESQNIQIQTHKTKVINNVESDKCRNHGFIFIFSSIKINLSLVFKNFEDPCLIYRYEAMEIVMSFERNLTALLHIKRKI
jgi:hypothetical protein